MVVPFRFHYAFVFFNSACKSIGSCVQIAASFLRAPHQRQQKKEPALQDTHTHTQHDEEMHSAYTYIYFQLSWELCKNNSTCQSASQPANPFVGGAAICWSVGARAAFCVRRKTVSGSLSLSLLSARHKDGLLSPIVLSGILSSQFFPSRTTSE
jgi:hypothetical protein